MDDTKTGKNAPAGLDEIAIQLAIYANSPWMWDMARQMWVQTPPNIRKDIATVTWIPINNPEASEVIKVDIAAGWQAAKATAWVREYQRRANREIAARVAACGSLEHISALFLELTDAGAMNPMLEALLEHRKAELKN